MTDATPTDRELEALKVLWDRREATVREIADAMNADGGDLAYTTVLSLLQVMEQKRLVGHRRDGKAYVYLPRVERQSTFRQLAGGFLEQSLRRRRRRVPGPRPGIEAALRQRAGRARSDARRRPRPFRKASTQRKTKMNAFIDWMAYWLADYGLATTLLLAVAFAAVALCRQPVKRLAVAKATIVALFALAGLCALPRWSVVSLVTAEPAHDSVIAAAPLPAVPPVNAPVTPTTHEPIADDSSSNPRRYRVPSADSHRLDGNPRDGLPGRLGLHRRLVGLRSNRRAAAGAAWPARPGNLREDFSFPLLISDEIDVPVAVGTWRPSVLVPARWIANPNRERTEVRAGPRSGPRQKRRPHLAGDQSLVAGPALGSPLLLAPPPQGATRPGSPRRRRSGRPRRSAAVCRTTRSLGPGSHAALALLPRRRAGPLGRPVAAAAANRDFWWMSISLCCPTARPVGGTAPRWQRRLWPYCCRS